jgi:fructosamine-3-kinase
MRQQRAANELASGNQLADVYRQGAQQMYGADQALAGQAQQIAQQKQWRQAKVTAT